MSLPNTRPRSRSTTDFMRVRQQGLFPGLAADIFSQLQQAVAERRRLEDFANALPKLSEADVLALEEADAPCPICLNPLLTILAEEEMALALDSPAQPTEELGVTRLKDTCGHMFCRKDIRNWMREGRTTCPTCRRAFVPPAPPSTVSNAASNSSSSNPPLSIIEPLASRLDLLMPHAPDIGADEHDLSAFLREMDIPEGLTRAFVETLRGGGVGGLGGTGARETETQETREVGVGTAGLGHRAFDDYEDDRSGYAGMYS